MDDIWYKAVSPETWPNWAVVFAALGATVVGLRTLRAIKRQADLQQAVMQQWVTIDNWKARYGDIDDSKTRLKVEFDITNPSGFPLRLKKFEILFRLPGCTRTSLLDPNLPDFRLCPKSPETIPIIIPLSPDESERFLRTGIDIGVEIGVIHTDMGPNGETPWYLTGYLNCQHGRNEGRATFISAALRAPEARQNR